MDGLERQQRLVDINTHIPIVFLTAQANDEEERRALDAGAVDILRNSISQEALRRVLASVFDSADGSYEIVGTSPALRTVLDRIAKVVICDSDIFAVDESWLLRNAIEVRPSHQPLADELVRQEKALIEAALAATKGRVSGPSGAAVRLGLPASTLDSKIRALKITKERFKTQP